MVHLWPLLDQLEQHIFQEALDGDELAVCAILDIAEERGTGVNPFEVGKCYFFETQTLYYVGKVVKATACWLWLEKASWVHWTGRKSRLMGNRSFNEKHFQNGEQTPRTEYVGDWILPVGVVSGAKEWLEEELPQESIQ